VLEESVRRRIVQAVEQRRDSVVRLLQDLVRLDSTTGREGEAQAYIARTLAALGLEVDVFEPDVEKLKAHPAFRPMGSLDFKGRPNVVGVLKGDPQAHSLLLNGHVDTIPAVAGEWLEDPFSGSVKEGEVFGRGSSDMKSGLIALLAAVKILVEAGLKPRGSVIIESVVDEEVSGFGTLGCVIRGYKADAGICGETSDMEIMPAAIGRLWFTIEVRGKSAGIATRWLAVDAIEKAYKVVQAVWDLEKIRVNTLEHRLYPDNRMALPCSVNMIQAGSYPSATPEVAVLQGSMGLMPYETIPSAEAQLRRQVSLICQADPWLCDHPPVVKFDGYAADGTEIPQEHPLVSTLAENFRAALGREPVYGGRTGAADTRYLSNYGDTPTVIFGPGVTAKMHMVNETVPVQNLIEAVTVLALSIYDWCQ